MPSAASDESLAASIRSAILQREAELTAAWLRHDVKTVDKIFANDFSEVTRKGKTLTKADILRAVAQNDETDTKTYEEQVHVVAANVAVSTMRIVDTGVRKGTNEQYSVETRVMNVWVLRGNGWQIVASQTMYTS